MGVARNATDDEIKSAYRKAARKCHPDKVAAEEKETAERKFKELNEAHEALTDPVKRRKHDRGGDMEDDDDDYGFFTPRAYQRHTQQRGGGRRYGGGGRDPFGTRGGGNNWSF